MTRTFRKRTMIPCSADALFEYHAHPGAFDRLTAPWEHVRVVQPLSSLHEGAEAVLEVSIGPIKQRWTAVHKDVHRGKGFCDVMRDGPFRRYMHTHTFEAVDETHCVLDDSIEYDLPGLPFAGIVGGPYVEERLERLFAFRHDTTRLDHQLFASLPKPFQRLRVGVTGASGLIGRELCTLLSVAGHEVRRFVRTPSDDETTIHWRPETGAIDVERANQLDVVVHLAGEPIADGALSPERKQNIWTSRVDATRLLVESLGRLSSPPRAFVSASAIGFYGSRGDELLDENSSKGSGFLADVCEGWEAAAELARDHGMRPARLRMGIVLSPAGGALARMLPVFKAGLGGTLGNGQQYMSPIAIDDAAAVILRAIVDDRFEGPFNVVGPEPCTNAEFTATLARVLHRFAALPVPSLALRVAFGEELASEALLTSNRVLPARLLEMGHAFRHISLEESLRHVLGRTAGGSAREHAHRRDASVAVASTT